jgi:putative transcriptional regulator
MTKRPFDKIKAGLDEARAYLEGTANKHRYGVHVPENVRVKKKRKAPSRPPLTSARRRSGA